MMLEHTDVLGVSVSVMNMLQALDTIEGWISKRQSQLVCVRDVLGVTLCHDDDELKNIHNDAQTIETVNATDLDVV